MLYTAQMNSKTLERVTPYDPQKSAEQRLSRQADIALATFKAGVCVSAALSTGQFDSHKNNDPDQMELIPELLAGIDYLMKRADAHPFREQFPLDENIFISPETTPFPGSRSGAVIETR